MEETESPMHKALNNTAVNNSTNRDLIRTDDGSFTFLISEVNETYHSRHGAEQESNHVFIGHGFNLFAHQRELSILEVGLGTGLNALLTYESCTKQFVHYTALEPFPLQNDLVKKLCDVQANESRMSFMKTVHECMFDDIMPIGSLFHFKKIKKGLQEMEADAKFDLIYFDAFGPQMEPDLWALSMMQRCFDLLKDHGVWVSYCAKGEVRRNLQKVGFQVERLQGPPGKREMLRAIKK